MQISRAARWRAILGVLLVARPCFAAGGPLDVPAPHRRAHEAIHRGQYEQALAAARNLAKDFPDHPLTFLVAAESHWGLIFCETGRINAREVWYLADRKTSRFDKEFFEAIERALAASASLRAKPETAAAGALYAGLTRGLRSRLYALRKQSMKSASEARQLYADLSAAVAQDSRLAPDAYLGLGAYNYYVDALSPLLKFIRILLRIPGGDREQGLEQLRIASEKAEWLASEAQSELAHIYGIREGRHAESLRLYEDLARRYPENALDALAAAFQAEAIGKRDAAIEWAGEAAEAAAHMDGVCRDRIGEAARGALARLKEARPF